MPATAAAQSTYPLVKWEDGVWSVTIGSIEPEIHAYSFLVEGLKVESSVIEVPGNPPRFDELQNVAHLSVSSQAYSATAQGLQRGLNVYVPPAYNMDHTRKFPQGTMLFGQEMHMFKQTSIAIAGLVLTFVTAADSNPAVLYVSAAQMTQRFPKLQAAVEAGKPLPEDMRPRASDLRGIDRSTTTTLFEYFSNPGYRATRARGCLRC
jgi:enterochelin esterase family protein